MANHSSLGRINILSIDGGGIRGIISAAILAALRAGIGYDLHEVFDLICGTSTGGIIALAIATPAAGGHPYRPTDLVNMYVRQGPAIFTKRWCTCVRQLFGPKYSAKPLEKVLRGFFRDTDLRSALTPLLISSYDLLSQRPFFFKSHKIYADASWNWPLWQVARAACAAPTFFPPTHLRDTGQDYALVDGGIFVNNPAMAAYAEACRLYPNAPGFYIVSVGAGNRDDRITYRRARRWGLLGWAGQIVPVIMDSVSEAVDYELDAIAGTLTYQRLQPDLNLASPETDDTSPQNMHHLQAQAQHFIAGNASLIADICRALRSKRGSNLPGIGG